MRHFFLYIITLLFYNFLSAQQLNPVNFSFESGIYSTAILLELSSTDPNVQIYYTTNGKEPTTSDNLYTTPIALLDLTGTPNSFSSIPTNPSLNHPYGTYSTVRANSRGWLPPVGEVQKAHVIKVKAFKTGFLPSKTVTKFFLITPLGTARYSLPILSITIDSVEMFSDQSGIYVYGNEPDGNYSQKDVSWERIMNFDLIENGISVYQQDVRVRIHGGGSRHSCKKNLRMYGEYDEKNNFTYPFFDDVEIKKYKRIILRSGGHTPNCFPRDDLAGLIVDGLNIDKQHFKHVIVFINGEYWGIHSIKERMDDYFLQNLYGIDDDSLTILDQEFDVQGNGYQADSAEMKNLELFIINNDMTNDVNYNYVASKIDVENYIDYMCAEIYLSNVDWVYSNVVIWRKTGNYVSNAGAGYDGKFRWALYDLDGGFGGDCKNAYYTVNTLNAATISTGIFASYTRFFRGLLENETFRYKFINRMCDLLNSWFKPEVVQAHISYMKSILDIEMMEEVNRWKFPSRASTIEDRNIETPSLAQWDTVFYLLDRFGERRARKQREHFLLKWPNIIDTSTVVINVNDVEMGSVKINTLLLNKNIPGVSNSIYPWAGIYMNTIPVPLKAIPKPGYRFVEWQNIGITQDEIIWTPNADTNFTAIFEPDPNYQPILINEVMLKNTTVYADNFNEYDDWTELFNPNNYSVNISECKLTKGNYEWTIPNGTSIPANGYLIFWNDKQTYQGQNHVNFKLQNIDDIVYLKTGGGETIDSLHYTPTNKNKSFGRYPNGSDTYLIFDIPTPKAFNDDFSNLNKIDKDKIELFVYPNPADDILHFNKTISFTIYNVLGKEVLKEQNKNSVNVSSLVSGVYILETNEKETLKIIIK
ncbi:MAG TPA: T9SS type A sorting domain-containing protein [Crocinitomix sp.]|nr:T9SS type A sorting domain-containing protein [Crocinitomix sp.]